MRVLKGMTVGQYEVILEFIQDHHRFGNYKSKEEWAKELKKYPQIAEYGFNIKYIESCYDSRTKDIGLINLRGLGNNLCFRKNHFAAIGIPTFFKYDNLFDWIMDYLKGEWNDPDILEQCKIKEK